jgi:hypothetical protein
MSSSYQVVLSSQEQAVLTARSRSVRGPYRDRLRATIVLAAAAGQANAAIARELWTGTVRKWRRRFAGGRLAGLKDAPRSGRPPAFTAADRAEVIALACALPAESGVPLSRWSGPDLARELSARCSIAASASTIGRWLARDALKPWQHRSWISVRDPQFAAKAARVLDLYAGTWDGKPLGDGYPFLLLVALVAAPLLASFSPNAEDLTHVLAGPSVRHWLGTDQLGRDVTSRLLYGGRSSVIDVLVATGTFLLAGVPLGLLAGYLGGPVDRIVSRVADVLFALPAIVILLMVVAIFPDDDPVAMITLGLIASPGLLRVIRGTTLALRQELFVRAAARPPRPAHGFHVPPRRPCRRGAGRAARRRTRRTRGGRRGRLRRLRPSRGPRPDQRPPAVR